MKIQEEFNKIYNKLEGKYEGYIQLSDKKLSEDFVYETKQKLNPLILGDSYVIEACFFDGNESINIRQVNDGYKVSRVKLNDFDDEQKTENIFFTNGYKKAKIVTIWEPKEDEYCENLEVLSPTMQLFAGFTDKKGEEL